MPGMCRPPPVEVLAQGDHQGSTRLLFTGAAHPLAVAPFRLNPHYPSYHGAITTIHLLWPLLRSNATNKGLAALSSFTIRHYTTCCRCFFAIAFPEVTIITCAFAWARLEYEGI